MKTKHSNKNQSKQDKSQVGPDSKARANTPEKEEIINAQDQNDGVPNKGNHYDKKENWDNAHQGYNDVNNKEEVKKNSNPEPDKTKNDNDLPEEI